MSISTIIWFTKSVAGNFVTNFAQAYGKKLIKSVIIGGVLTAVATFPPVAAAIGGVKGLAIVKAAIGAWHAIKPAKDALEAGKDAMEAAEAADDAIDIAEAAKEASKDSVEHKMIEDPFTRDLYKELCSAGVDGKTSMDIAKAAYLIAIGETEQADKLIEKMPAAVGQLARRAGSLGTINGGAELTSDMHNDIHQLVNNSTSDLGQSAVLYRPTPGLSLSRNL